MVSGADESEGVETKTHDDASMRIVSERRDSRVVEAVPSLLLGVESESGVVTSRETSVVLVDGV